ncbi:MAG: RNA polymerase sigma factor [Planctomycetota bacterium]
MPPPERDEALVVRAMGGDRPALGALIARHGADLQFALEGRVRHAEDALDLAQETWMRVARSLPQFRVGQRFRPWLFAIGFNALRDHLRRTGARPEAGALAFGAGDDDDLGSATADGTARLEEREAIEFALAHVEEPFATAMRLVDVLGLEHAEAAEALDCAVGTVRSRLSRGRAVFRTAYERLMAETVTEGAARGAARTEGAGSGPATGE